MNANELADALEEAPYYTSFEGEAAVMLRHQANQIEALKTQLAYLESKVYGGTTK